MSGVATYQGRRSADGLALAFDAVDLGEPGSVVELRVAVQVGADVVFPGECAVEFVVGGRSVPSAPVRTAAPPGRSPSLEVSPSDGWESVLVPGGRHGEPGVTVRSPAGATDEPSTVTVTLPPDLDLAWGREDSPGHAHLLAIHHEDSCFVFFRRGTPLAGGRALVFTGVETASSRPDHRIHLSVEVRRSATARPGRTSLLFTVDGIPCGSTPVVVTGDGP
ncbi:hypothetical protein ACIA8O_17930 [Kitasatospora sp. NPDC051853]|uniref:hypothetical protein n=1 Tax=Kitasatospora sp. NPDC051853 TaxID=3364058 RepID=UPI0037B4DA6F